MRNFLLSGTAACVMLPFAGGAEESAPVELDTIEVTASPFKRHSDLELAQPSDVLTGDKLMLRGQSTLGETVGQQLGVSASDFNPTGASRPIIRGLGGQRVKILENGQSAMDVSDISVDHAVSIEPVLSQQIEVLKGPSTLMYGSGAIGGVVNVVNERLPDELPDGVEGAFEGRYNSASTERTGAFTVTGAVGNMALHLDGMYLRTDDYDAASGTVENSAVEKGQWGAGASWIDDSARVGVSVSQLYNKYEIPVEEGEDEAPFIDMEQTRVNLKSRVDSPMSGISGLDFDFAWSDYHHTEFENPGEPGTDFDNVEFNLGAQLQHDPLWDWNGAFGLQGGTRGLEATGEEAFIPSTDIWNIAGYLLEERDFDDWHVELGARVEHKQFDPDGRPSRDFTPYSLTAGAVWQFADGYSFSTNLSRSQRAPQVQELYALGPHVATQTFEIGDPDLDVESSNNLDLEFRRTGGDWGWTVSGYFNYYQKFIYLEETDLNGDGVADRVDEEGEADPDGPFLRVVDRQRDAIFTGVEAETTYRLYQGSYGSLDSRLWGDFVRAWFVGGGNVPRIPPWRVGGSLDYMIQNWTASFEVFHAGEQDQTSNLETTTPGYTMLNVDLIYKLPVDQVDFSIYARGTNLLNEDARRSTSFLKDVAPLPGRAAVVGIRGEF